MMNWRYEQFVRRHRAALNDQCDAAVDEGLIGVVARSYSYAIDGSRHPRPIDLDDKFVGFLKRPRERSFGEKGLRAIPNADEKQLIRALQKNRVEAPQTLDTDAHSHMFCKVSFERRLHPVIAPLPATMDDHAFAAVLGNPKGLREARREIVD